MVLQGVQPEYDALLHEPSDRQYPQPGYVALAHEERIKDEHSRQLIDAVGEHTRVEPQS